MRAVPAARHAVTGPTATGIQQVGDGSQRKPRPFYRLSTADGVVMASTPGISIVCSGFTGPANGFRLQGRRFVNVQDLAQFQSCCRTGRTSLQAGVQGRAPL